jgi:pyruvate formate lyase activating enzyme
MKLGGVEQLTLIDYPGKVAATVFTLGCNFRCPFCYSTELVMPKKIEKQPTISEEDFFEFLEKRKGRLEGVVICGGEPTIHQDLPIFARKIKEKGFLVKLDSNGSNPNMLEKLIKEKLIDYVAMDVKGPKEKYKIMTGLNEGWTDNLMGKIEKSIKVLKKGSIDYEFRTTVVPDILKKEDLLKISSWIKGAKKYYLQNYRAQKETINPDFMEKQPYEESFLEEVREEIKDNFDICKVR